MVHKLHYNQENKAIESKICKLPTNLQSMQYLI